MKPFRIIALASAVFVVCILIAYHNTASVGYDKHDIIYYNSEGVDIMDYHVEYDVIRYNIYRLRKIAPERLISI